MTEFMEALQEALTFVGILAGIVALAAIGEATARRFGIDLSGGEDAEL